MTLPGRNSRRSRVLPVLLMGASCAALFSCPALAQVTALSQVPTQLDAHLSDAKLQSLMISPVPTGVCAADNFVLHSEAVITQVRIWGIYFPGGVAPALDRFTVVLHSDAGGLPGAALSTQHDVPAARQATGATVDGIAEHVYTLVPSPLVRAPGTYWIEVCNDTTGDPASFYWEFGATDAVHGIPGAAFKLTAPAASSWQVLDVDSGRQDLAIEITARPVAIDVPTLAEWVIAILGAVIGVDGLRRIGNRNTA